MLASRLLKSKARDRARTSPMALHRIANSLTGLFRIVLAMALANPLAVIVITVLVGAVAFLEFGTLHQELTPSEDRASRAARGTCADELIVLV